jgi:riboflavin kinase/FMN adenylyltransferase
MSVPGVVPTFLGDDERVARPTAVVIGNFDGVHHGHQSVLLEAVAEARARGLEPSVLTFFPHPAGVLGRAAPALLTTLGRRAELMGELGVTRVFVKTFDRAFASWSPARFAEDLLRDRLGAGLVIVGDNFRFGFGRAGDLSTLRALGEANGFEAHAHAMASDGRGVFSSTRARTAILDGDLAEAAAVLGRPHGLAGTVVHGEAKGRLLGFPTANLDGVEELLPPNGVYVVRVTRASGVVLGGVMNIGVRPTVAGDGARRTVEAHCLDFDGDLYGERLRVDVVDRLREEKRFGGLAELKAQIALDAAAAREALVVREPLVSLD